MADDAQLGDAGDHPDLGEPAPEKELLQIVQQLHAYLDWQQELGTTGIVKGTSTSKEAAEPKEQGPLAAAPPSLAAAPPSPQARAKSAPQTTQRKPAPQRPVERQPTIASENPPQQPAQPQVGPRLSQVASLGELQQLVASCKACELHTGRTNSVFARGTGSSGLCFVGEGPGADEDAQGLPFVGAAGQLLDKMIAAMGLAREEVYICNIVKCRPPKNRKPSPTEAQMCGQYLHRQLEILSPQVIVALGGTAVEGLLGLTTGITRIRGKFRLYQGTIPVMPTFHPAYLLRNSSAKRQVWTDLRQVVNHMGRQLPKS